MPFVDEAAEVDVDVPSNGELTATKVLLPKVADQLALNGSVPSVHVMPFVDEAAEVDPPNE
jgi:hypothetical protein